jgi:signal transduction histidine kinase/DNA-binding response OmpR family regulator/ligand-binding sensor domain-containing protein
MWIGTASRGINILTRDRKRFYHYEMNASDPHSLSDNFVNKIIEDRAGNIWIATQEGGVSRYSPHNRKFTHLLRKTELPEGLESNNLNAVIEDDNGDLWVSFIGYGLAKYDRKRKRVIDVGSLFYQDNSALRVPIPAMCRDASGVFWLGTWGDGLRRFDPMTREITFYRHDPNNPNSLSDNRIVAVYPRSDGTIWISTQSGGLNRFDPRTNTFTRFLHDPEDPTSISSNLTHSICEDQNGSLWIATLGGGLNQLIEEPTSEPQIGGEQNQPVERKFRRFQHDPADSSSLAHNLIIALLADSRGNLWVGTGGGGLDKLDIEKGTFQHFSEANGYPFGVVTHIQEDARGNLWVVTTKALVKFNEHGVDETDRQFLLFDFTDGRGVNLLPTLPSATWRSPSGEIFLAGYEGITAFYPDQIQTNPYIPPVKITQFSISGKPAILDTSITVKKVIILPYQDNTFSFEFAALNYVQPHKNQYAYKLEGFDKEWIYAGNRRRATYTNIDPGTYIFRVKASNNDGVWNEEGASVRIIITPPWWRTRWAYASYVLLLGLVLYGIRRFELNRFHLRNELRRREFEARKLQEMDEMKSRFFANISHEFRTPLTLILGPLETLLSQTKDPERKQNLRLMYGNARRLQRLIDQLLDLSKLRSGRMALRVRPMNVAAFVRAVTISFASLAERRRIRLSFSGPEEGLRLYVDRDKLEKIVSNLISNALKFTPEGGEVSVAVTPVRTEAGRGFVEIAVADTGVGIAPEHLEKVFDRFYQVDDSSTRSDGGTGIGLALAKELVELHRGQIWAESEPGKGATFFVRLPLGKEHLQPHEIAAGDSLTDDIGTEVTEDGPGETAEITPAAAAPKDAPLLLIVEDNTDVRSYMRCHLQGTYRIIEAEHGVAGFERAVAEIPDLIISDVMMPEMDGFELCEKLKTDPRTSHIPVILLTARASAESKIEGLETGADDYITKPFNVKELEIRGHNLIEQRRRLRERFQRQFLLQPREVAVASADDRFLCRAMEVVEAHLDDPAFSTERFAREVGLSATHLHRKLKALTGKSPTEFIRMVRLKRAAYLIEKDRGNIAEIAYEVGFNNPSYFAARFRELYGMTPSEYAARAADVV